MARFLPVAGLAIALGCVAPAAPPEAAPPPDVGSGSAGVPRTVLWLSVSGLTPDRYLGEAPPMPVLGRLPDSQAFRSVEEHPEAETYEGLLVVRFDAGLFFASADSLEDRLRELAQNSETAFEVLVISFEGIDFIDSQGSEKIDKILQLAETYGAEVRLARVKPHVLALMRRDGVIARLGEDHLYGNLYEAARDRVEQ